MSKVVVIGAGNGGLTTATLLAKAGLDVVVLEAHSYPGGCAGTFRRKRFRFDAGATLAGGFNQGEIMQLVANEVGISKWQALSSDPAMTVYLPDETTIYRFGDKRRWNERIKHFGEQSIEFWKWQERTANAMWDLSSHHPPFPPQDLYDLGDLISTGVKWFSINLTSNINPGMLLDALLPVERHLRNQSQKLKQFIDAQLLISSQTISRYANALFSAAALDLPRRGIVHFKGGIGTIAYQLVNSLQNQSGEIKYKQKVTSIHRKNGEFVINTNKGYEQVADIVVANLTPWDLKNILHRPPKRLKYLPTKPNNGWGAFMLYIGLDTKHIPQDFPLHHQIIGDNTLTEGNSIFVSISPEWDETRAPTNKRAITISTHTNFTKWWSIFKEDKSKYGEAKEFYKNKMLELAIRVIPNIKKAELIEIATPVTFQHFTNRKFGWVGGFRQENLFKTFGPKIDKDLWMVGDSIFPGQSTAAVSLGGIRVAKAILQQMNQ